MPHPADQLPDFLEVSPNPHRVYRAPSERTRVVQIRERCVSRQQEDARDRRHFLASDLPCAKPTPYLPGSKEKIDVMEQREEANLPHFHPDDATADETVPEWLYAAPVDEDCDDDSDVI